MTQTLSTHFVISEFTRSDAARNASIVNQPPPEVIALAREFCAELLEPIRERFGKIVITSGYRSPALNALVHGVSESDHQWTEERIAADFFTPEAGLQEVFDWIRLESSLPFDQVIREHASGRGGDCIHISFRRQPRRIALVGATHNQGGYERVEVSPVAEARG